MKHHDDFWPDDDHVAWLFAIAIGEEKQPDDLSQPDRGTLKQICQALNAIDEAWKAAPQGQNRIEALFYGKLAAQEPEHPWIKANEVRTLGDLARASSSELPSLPKPAHDALLADQTPLETLTDLGKRTTAVGQFIQRAKLPLSQVTGFLNWLNACMIDLVPLQSKESKFVFTRRPNRISRPQSKFMPPRDEEDSG